MQTDVAEFAEWAKAGGEEGSMGVYGAVVAGGLWMHALCCVALSVAHKYGESGVC